MLKPSNNPILQTVALCIVCLVFTFPKHMGFILAFAFVFLIPSMFKSAYIVFVKKKGQKQRTIQTALWAVTCTAVIVHHAYLHYTTREFAQEVAVKIHSYKDKNGSYPKDIETIGYTSKDLKPYWLAYFHNDNDPHLFYAATWIVYDAYTYDFTKGIWALQAS
ncbi:MAG TPA: hypothetical protein VIM96_11280 [Pseudomonadales bacterium]